MIKFLDSVRTVHIIALTMTLAGLCLMAIPSSTGTVSALDDIYHMTPIFFGAMTFIGGVVVFNSPKPAIFLIATLPFLMYIAAAMIYLLLHPGGNPAGLVYFIGYYLLIIRQYFIYYEAEDGRSR